jgi:hypothetical protein
MMSVLRPSSSVRLRRRQEVRLRAKALVTEFSTFSWGSEAEAAAFQTGWEKNIVAGKKKGRPDVPPPRLEVACRQGVTEPGVTTFTVRYVLWLTTVLST